MRFKRSSGVLLHPTSLPGRFGIGDLGPEAYRFVDWLADAGQTFWQLMPLGPTGYGDSPYSSFSAFAGNTNLVSPERLVEMGLLTNDDLKHDDLKHDTHLSQADRVDYGKVIDYKRSLLEKAYRRFKVGAGGRAQYEGFLDYASVWLDDYALFAALKDEHGGESWHTWDEKLARRDESALRAAREELTEQIEAQKFFQYLFFEQWLRLKAYCRERGVWVVGDMPIFVAHNSADVWSQPHLFKLEEDGSPASVAGVPPDAFSRTGQLWGNPVYDWERMKTDNFAWWVRRVRETLKQVDVVRLDHFRGFASFWEVPAGHETAEHGRWVHAPGQELFHALREAHGGDLPIIAEDLGTITPDVHQLRDEFGFPGMRVLQFAFGGDPRDTHLPHVYTHNTVVYTGTHDNDTTVGWFESRDVVGDDDEAARLRRERDYCLRYLDSDGTEIHWDFIRAALASVADIAIIPLQDVLGLSSDARMNIPASAQGNWGWRFKDGALTDALRRRLRDLTGLYARLPDQ